MENYLQGEEVVRRGILHCVDLEDEAGGVLLMCGKECNAAELVPMREVSELPVRCLPCFRSER